MILNFSFTCQSDRKHMTLEEELKALGVFSESIVVQYRTPHNFIGFLNVILVQNFICFGAKN